MDLRFPLVSVGAAIWGLGFFVQPMEAATRQPAVPRVVRFAVAVDPVTVSSVADVRQVATEIFADPRGWASIKRTRFVEVPWADARLRIFVTTPKRVDRECKPLPTSGYKSCTKGWDVFINEERWRTGAPASRMVLADYRRYLLNHEVGHALGEHHQTCRGPGRLASVMVQQTIGLQGCRPNPWPNPSAPLPTTLPTTTSSAVQTTSVTSVTSVAVPSVASVSAASSIP